MFLLVGLLLLLLRFFPFLPEADFGRGDGGGVGGLKSSLHIATMSTPSLSGSCKEPTNPVQPVMLLNRGVGG